MQPATCALSVVTVKRLVNLHMPGLSQVPSEFAEHLGRSTVHAFPTLKQLSLATEDALRADGYGYRAKYIVGAVQALQERPEGGHEWLLVSTFLRSACPVAAGSDTSLFMAHAWLTCMVCTTIEPP